MSDLDAPLQSSKRLVVLCWPCGFPAHLHPQLVRCRLIVTTPHASFRHTKFPLMHLHCQASRVGRQSTKLLPFPGILIWKFNLISSWFRILHLNLCKSKSHWKVKGDDLYYAVICDVKRWLVKHEKGAIRCPQMYLMSGSVPEYCTFTCSRDAAL